jgi:hypothetical protein
VLGVCRAASRITLIKDELVGSSAAALSPWLSFGRNPQVDPAVFVVPESAPPPFRLLLADYSWAVTLPHR